MQTYSVNECWGDGDRSLRFCHNPDERLSDSSVTFTDFSLMSRLIALWEVQAIIFSNGIVLFCFCLSDGQVVQFHLASCGQDNHLKIWMINKFNTGGKSSSLSVSIHRLWWICAKTVNLFMQAHSACVKFCRIWKLHCYMWCVVAVSTVPHITNPSFVWRYCNMSSTAYQDTSLVPFFYFF